jgi:hypothetical protein
LAAQLARKFTLHWFDIESGSAYILGALPKEFWGNVNLYNVADLPDNPRALKLMDKVLRPMLATQRVWIGPQGDAQEKPVAGWEEFSTHKLTANDVIVVDSGTALSNSAMNRALGSVMEAEMAFAKKEFDHYGKQGFYLSNILSRMKQLPCHVVFIMHETVLENLNGTKQIQPLFGTRAFAKTIIRDFNHILYLYRKNNKHCITSSTTHSAHIIARSSSHVNVTCAEDIFQLFGQQLLSHAVEFDGKETPSDTVSSQTAQEHKA